jgi:hypothetical protein
MSESAEWLAKHKGRHLRTVGYIWQCGDDYCECEQAQVVDYFENKADHRWRVPITVWEGTFTTREGRYDGGPSPAAELAEYRRALRITNPEREASIEWQQGVNYGQAQSGRTVES